MLQVKVGKKPVENSPLQVNNVNALQIPKLHKLQQLEINQGR